MFPALELNESSRVPLYRQLYDKIAESIRSGLISDGDRLPATRELASQIGLNRTTVSAAYALLEEDGLIKGHVGRGSFVEYRPAKATVPHSDEISFASSRPAGDQFPLAEFQATCREVTCGAQAAAILQLGSPYGYPPLREHLLHQARSGGYAGPEDDILICSGCQQALDLLQRVLLPAGETVAVEDPVYHGLKNVFVRGGARLAGVPVGSMGMAVDELARVLAVEQPRLLVVTPSFQNPTGATLPLEAREIVVRLAREFGVTLVENDIYGELRYHGQALARLKTLAKLKTLDGAGTILLGSFSKVAFPGLRVGWIIAPRPLIARLAEAKQWSDLHTDHLSQAILLRFVESGRLESHLQRVRAAGVERLEAVISACREYLPAGAEFTEPQGGMSLWVRLPEPLDAAELLPRAQRQNVDYLPGRYFSVSRHEPGALRLSFGSLSP
ncbi:MAG: PLP-dependent aminotransferase family protein, partial [Bryobacteraceae bacterium]